MLPGPLFRGVSVNVPSEIDMKAFGGITYTAIRLYSVPPTRCLTAGFGKNSLYASKPSAEAPMATTGKASPCIAASILKRISLAGAPVLGFTESSFLTRKHSFPIFLKARSWFIWMPANPEVTSNRSSGTSFADSSQRFRQPLVGTESGVCLV